MSNVNIIKPPKRLSGDTEAVIRHIYDQINILSNATNRASTGEARDRTGGKSGDIQLVHDKASGQYGIEGRFEEGWMRFGLGEGVLVQSNQRQPFIPPSSGQSESLTRTIQDMFPSVARLRLDVNPGSVTSIPIFAIGEDGILKDGDIITVTSLNGYVATFVISADVAGAATSISVEQKIVGRKLLAGSNIYLSQKSLGTWISQLENSITIGAGINDFDVIARVNGSQSGSVSSIPLKSALTVKLRSGWKLLVTDLGTGDVFTVQLSADHNVGATSLSVYPATVNCDDNSPIRLDQLSLLAYINVTATDVSLSSQAMQGAAFIGETMYATAVSNYSSIWVASPGITMKLPVGQTLVIQDKDDPENMLTIVLDTQAAPPVTPGPHVLWINNVSNPKVIAAGSKIFIPPRVFSGTLKVAFDEISLSVKRDELRDSLNGKLLGEVNTVSGSNITLKSPYLKHTIYKDDIVTFGPNAAVGQTQITNPEVKKTVTKTGSPSYWGAGSSSITLDNYAGIGADMLMYMDQAGPVSIGSSIQVLLDSIIFDTAIIKSEDYYPGSSGWAIKGDGSAEFNDVTVRGIIESLASYSEWTGVRAIRSYELGPDNGLEFNLSTYTSLTPYPSGKLGSGLVNVDQEKILLTWDNDSTEFWGIAIRNKRRDYLLPPGNEPAISITEGISRKPTWLSNPLSRMFEVYHNGLITSANQPVPRVFSGSGIPGTIDYSVVGDLYRRTGTEELYIKTASTPTWLKIGPTTLPTILSYTMGPEAGNPPEGTRPNGDFHYDTDTETLFLKHDALFSPFIEVSRNYMKSSESRSVLIYRGSFASDPGSPTRGDVYYNTGSSQLRFYTGTTWTAI